MGNNIIRGVFVREGVRDKLSWVDAEASRLRGELRLICGAAAIKVGSGAVAHALRAELRVWESGTQGDKET